MSKKVQVSKFCSILNYLRHKDETLLDLMTDLCVSHLLKPRKDGLTFIRPGAKLFKILAEHAEKDPEKAVDMLRGMIIHEHIDDASDLEGAKTLGGVLGKNNISLDKDFKARNSHRKPDGSIEETNMAVYIAEEPLTHGGEAKERKTGAKKRTGGGGGGQHDRQYLFESVVRSDDPYELAKQYLVGIGNWEPYQGRKEVCRQFSYDTLTSLAILLRPYAANKPSKYISDECVKMLRDHDTPEKRNRFVGGSTFDIQYDKLMKCGEGAVNCQDARSALLNDLTKSNAVDKLKTFYASQSSFGTPHELFAEAELRVIMAVLRNNGTDDEKTLRDWYHKCKLDEPYLCVAPKQGQLMETGVYYSTVFLIVKSDALMYCPGSGFTDGLNAITSSDNISHDDQFKDNGKRGGDEQEDYSGQFVVQP